MKAIGIVIRAAIVEKNSEAEIVDWGQRIIEVFPERFAATGSVGDVEQTEVVASPAGVGYQKFGCFPRAPD